MRIFGLHLRSKLKTFLSTRRPVTMDGPECSSKPIPRSEEEGVESTRPKFGQRHLMNQTDVFKHNAWDNVEWDEELEMEALEKISKNSNTKVAEEDRKRYDSEASTFWDKFYQTHQDKFFKDRHWLFTEFPELYRTCSEKNPKNVSLKENAENTLFDKSEQNAENPVSGTDQLAQKSRFRILEVGCGVGNTVIPILEGNLNPNVFVYCCDFSETAINLVKNHESVIKNSERCTPFVCDVTRDTWTDVPFEFESLDVVLLIFVLSAIDPSKMKQVLSRLGKYLKPGGVIFIRDYGRYDMAQLRFKDGSCLGENFYVRGDGTQVYFFEKQELDEMFDSVGFRKMESGVDRRLQVNRGKRLTMYRVWVQGKYTKL